MIRFIIMSILGVLLWNSCRQNPKAIQTQFEQRAKVIGQRYVPDKSLNIYDVKLERPAGHWTMTGRTNIPAAKTALNAFCDSLFGKEYFTNHLRLLPAQELKDSTYALVKVSVAHLRRQPRHAAELIDQTIMGRVLSVLDENDGWYLCQTNYGYVGWVSGSSITRTNRAGAMSWEKARRVRVIGLNGTIYSQADVRSLPLSDVVLNMELAGKKNMGRWTEVYLPDKRSGFVFSNLISDVSSRPDSGSAAILRSAESMLGVPYLWGGNSNKGNDCSGFTQTVFKAHGVQLPRDANQQAKKGVTIMPDSTFSNLKPGDLLFFGAGKKVTHVGISLGGARFIHQAGQVHFNSFDKSSPEYNPARRKTFKFAKRILK